MERRFILAALAVAIAGALPAGASAATAPSAPQLTTPQYVSPAHFTWTPGADPLNIVQTVWRAPGACTTPPAAGQLVATYPGNTQAEHFAVPGDGTFCFFVRASDAFARKCGQPGPHAHDRHHAADLDGRRRAHRSRRRRQRRRHHLSQRHRCNLGRRHQHPAGRPCRRVREWHQRAAALGHDAVHRRHVRPLQHRDGQRRLHGDRHAQDHDPERRPRTAPDPGPARARRRSAGDSGRLRACGRPGTTGATGGGAATANDKTAPHAPTKVAVVQPRSRTSASLVPLTLHW